MLPPSQAINSTFEESGMWSSNPKLSGNSINHQILGSQHISTDILNKLKLLFFVFTPKMTVKTLLQTMH